MRGGRKEDIIAESPRLIRLGSFKAIIWARDMEMGKSRRLQDGNLYEEGWL